MKMHDEFISTYKSLEGLLDIQVRDFEDTLSDDDGQKLRLCRMIRNYIQHNDDYEKFIAITPTMQKFLDDMVYSLKTQDGILKDHMITITKHGVLNVNDSIFDAAQLLKSKKRDFTYVFDKDGKLLGSLSKNTISDLFAEGVTKTTKISKYVNTLDKVSYKELEQTSPMCDVDRVKENVIFVVNKANKIVGFFINNLK